MDDEKYGALEEHYAREQSMEVWARVGVANMMINRFHATFHTDVDEEIMAAVAAGDRAAGACAIALPTSPANNGAQATLPSRRAHEETWSNAGAGTDRGFVVTYAPL